MMRKVAQDGYYVRNVKQFLSVVAASTTVFRDATTNPNRKTMGSHFVFDNINALSQQHLEKEAAINRYGEHLFTMKRLLIY